MSLPRRQCAASSATFSSVLLRTLTTLSLRMVKGAASLNSE